MGRLSGGVAAQGEAAQGLRSEVRSSRLEAVVVGAGPAGSAAALTLARSGVSVLLLDRTEFPRWKVCGGCLGPAAMRILDELGLGGRVREAGGVPLERMLLRAGSRQARIPLQGSLALSRNALDSLLAQAVADAGGEVRLGVGVRRARQDGDSAELRVGVGGDEVEIQAGVVVDASGLGGLRMEGERPAESVAETSRTGLGAIFPPGGTEWLPPGELWMTVGPEGYVGMVRLEDGSVNVAAAVEPSALRRDGPRGVVERIVGSAGHRLPGEDPVRGWRGTPALTRAPARAGQSRVLRAGDAAGYVEPFTGEGMGWALAAGVGVAARAREVMANGAMGDFGAWDRTRRRSIARRQRLCRLLAAGLRRRRLVELSVALLEVVPGLAAPLVRSTAGVSPAVLRWAGEVPATAGSR
ncbi:MAG: FAD-dependent monooxygenase [Longimicrobiales bacterium]|nr:FAD-dependent monooxygenase [Longimicrobiales bacterium]